MKKLLKKICVILLNFPKSIFIRKKPCCKIVLLFALMQFPTILWRGSEAFAQTEQKIFHDSLPPALHNKLHELFEKYLVSNIVKATDASGMVTYKMEARKEKTGNGSTTVFITYLTYESSGKRLSKKKDKEIYYTDSPKQNPKPTPKQSNDGHNHQH